MKTLNNNSRYIKVAAGIGALALVVIGGVVLYKKDMIPSFFKKEKKAETTKVTTPSTSKPGSDKEENKDEPS